MKESIKYITFIIILLNINSVFAQELVFQSFDLSLNSENDTAIIGNINIEECNYETIQIATGGIFYFSDITFDSDSIYYNYLPFDGVGDPANILFRTHFEPYYEGIGVEIFQETKEGITCDKADNIYLAGEALSRWNTETGQTTELGMLPASMACQGDLTFRQGKLYLSSVSHTLVEVDLDNPMNSSVVMNFPSGIGEIHGMATVNITCDSVETYVSASHPIDGSTIYRIDFETMTLEEICHYDFFITGLASYDECIFPECNLTVDLDVDNSSGADQIGDFQRTNACTFPVSITDADISLYSETTDIDSIIISLSNSFSNQEFLSVPSNPSLDIVGNNTTQLVLVNNGSAEISDFGQTLQMILYHNEDTQPIYGERIIEITAHFGPFQSSIARSLIPIEEPDIDANFSATMIDCFGNANGVILTTPTGGIAPYSLIWSTGENESEIEELNTGTYYLTVTDASSCTIIDSVIITQPDALVLEILSSGLDTFCGVEGALTAIVNGGTEPYNYTWSNQESIADNSPLTPGNYSLSVQDANGCTIGDTYTLYDGIGITNITNQTSCFGAEVIIDGQVYTSDTSFCLAYTLANGCDSLECYDLNFFEENSILFIENICSGDSIFIQDNYYSADTILSFGYIDANGCDSTVVYDIQVFEAPIIEFEIVGSNCEDEELLIEANEFQSYEWSTGSSDDFIVVDQSGFYKVTVTDDNDCTASDDIEVFIAPPLILEGDTSFILAPETPIDVFLQTNADLVTIQWQPSDYLSCDTCLVTTITPATVVNYSILAIDQNGCTDTAFVQVDLLENNLFVPNIFTPNGDGYNDRITVYANPTVIPKILDFTVVSRNGHVVFQAQNMLPNFLGWNGLFNGRPAQLGTYILYITYEDYRGDINRGIYEVSLVR